MITEGHYVLDWQRREHHQLTIQLYAVEDDGQIRLVEAIEQAPFESDGQVLRSMYRQLLIDLARSAV